MLVKCLTSIVTVSLVLITSVAGANNWPSFRGRRGNGVGEGEPPKEWDVRSGKNVVWKVGVEGLALSSPIIWQNRLFLTTAVGSTPTPKFEPDPSFGYGIIREKDTWNWKLICLDKESGRHLWDRVAHTGVPQQGRHSESTHANPTPATDGQFVVAMFGSEGLFCYDLEGNLKWKKEFGILQAGPENHPDLEWGYGSSPIIYRDRVIVQCDVQNRSTVEVVDLKSGEGLLRIEREDIPSWATPNAQEVKGRGRIICNGYKNVAAYDLETGAKIWWLEGKGDVPVPRPVFGHGLVYCTAGHGGRGLYAIKEDAVGNLTPTAATPTGLAWWHHGQGSYLPTPIVYDGILYVGNERGVLTTYDPKTGEQIYERRIVPEKGGPYYASPVAAGGKLYFTQNSGEIHVVEAGRDFKRLATNPMGERTMATPAISAGRLFVRTRSHLYCIGD